ncbi:hypothetical protein [Pseudomonas lactis]
MMALTLPGEDLIRERQNRLLEDQQRRLPGKGLGRVRKSESLRTWMQLLLIVAVPFRQDTHEVVQALTRSTLDEAVQRRLL